MSRSPSFASKFECRINLRSNRRIPNRAAHSRLLIAAFIVATITALASSAAAQSFTLQMQGFVPGSVLPSGSASSNLVLTPLNGFSESVSMSCSITPAPPNGDAGCLVSPQTVTPPTGAYVTITTDTWSAGSYTVTITATPTSGTAQTASQLLTVLSVTPTFTITLQRAISPTSVSAGSAGTGFINVNPVNGYTGTITLSCSSVTPVVVSPPVCSFSPSNITFSGSTSSATSTLTISTIGPLTPITQRSGLRGYYAIFVPLPMLVLLGACACGKKLRVCGLFLLLLTSAMILLMPACSTPSTPNQVNSSSVITPNGTYTFTITGVDDTTGFSASNTTSTVTLTVTTATTN